MYCYNGKLLEVDLSREKLEEKALSEEDLDLFIGGSGLAAKILFDLVDPSVDPLSPENVLVFMTAPLTGTLVPTSSRFTVAAKSPLTKGWGEAHAGGFWGVELKRAGFDGIIVRGEAKDPVYLYINNGEAEIRDASKIWDLDTYEADQAIKSELKDERIRCGIIGPAGANMVNFACIAFDVRPDGPRVAGRCGMGAVMGSKKLKAIAVKGSGSLQVANLRILREYVKRTLPSIMSYPTTQIYSVYGTSGEVDTLYEYGDVPIKNFSQGTWDEIEKLSGRVVNQLLVKAKKACFNCPIGCWRYVEFEEGSKTYKGRLLEYEILTSLGSLLLISDPKEVAKLNEKCNRLGLDAISAGVTIAWFIESYEKGFIGKGDVQDLEPKWGDPEFVDKVLDLIARREGIGDLLARGVKEASKKFRESEDFAMHSKGTEIPMHDPRAFKGMGLQYATSNRGADHLYGLVLRIEQGERITDLGIHERVNRSDYEGKGRIVAIMEDWHEVIESLGTCKFLMITPGHLTSMYAVAMGKRIQIKELHKKGTRIFTLKRIFNLACGLDKKADTLPNRLLKEPLKDGGAAGQIVELEQMLQEYYQYRNWNVDGYPTKECLEDLGLTKILEESKYPAYKQLLSKI